MTNVRRRKALRPLKTLVLHKNTAFTLHRSQLEPYEPCHSGIFCFDDRASEGVLVVTLRDIMVASKDKRTLVYLEWAQRRGLLPAINLFDEYIKDVNLDKIRPIFSCWEDLKLSGCSVRRTEFSHASIYGCNFDKCNFMYSHWEFASFDGTKFSECDLRYARFTNATFNDCCLSSSILQGVVWDRATVTGSRLARSKITTGSMDGAEFKYCDFEGAVFRGVDMKNVRFIETDLRRVRFERCRNLSTASFEACIRETTDQPIDGWTVNPNRYIVRASRST